MSASIIDGKKIASEYKDEIKTQIQTIVSNGHRAPCLAVILVGNDPASEVYVGHKKRACSHAGILANLSSFRQRLLRRSYLRF